MGSDRKQKWHTQCLYVGATVLVLGILFGAELAWLGLPTYAASLPALAGGCLMLLSPLVRRLELGAADRPGRAVVLAGELAAAAALGTHALIWCFVYVVHTAYGTAGGARQIWLWAANVYGVALLAGAGVTLLQLLALPRAAGFWRSVILAFLFNTLTVALLPAVLAVAFGVLMGGAAVTAGAVSREVGPGLSRSSYLVPATIAGVLLVMAVFFALVWFIWTLFPWLGLLALPLPDGSPHEAEFWNTFSRRHEAAPSEERPHLLDHVRLLNYCHGLDCRRYARAFLAGGRTFAGRSAKSGEAFRLAAGGLDASMALLTVTLTLYILYVGYGCVTGEINMGLRGVEATATVTKVGFGVLHYEFALDSGVYSRAYTERPLASYERLKVGDPLAVRYLPENPSVNEPELERGWVSQRVKTVFLLALPGSVVLLCLLYTFYYARLVRKLLASP